MRSFRKLVLSLACISVINGCASLPLPSDILAKPKLPVITEVGLPLAKYQPQSKGEVYYDPNDTATSIYDTKGHSNERLGKYFRIRDFSHTGDIAFRYARIDPKLVTCLNELRHQLGQPMRVNSAYRSWGYNQQLVKEGQKASKKSYHLSGKAADVAVPSMSTSKFVNQVYASCGCGTGIGIAGSWFHIDTRGRSVRPWGYASTSSVQLATARRIHKSMCGGGGRDVNEIGQEIVGVVSSTFKMISSGISKMIKGK